MANITTTPQIVYISNGSTPKIYTDGIGTATERLQFQRFLERNGYEMSPVDSLTGETTGNIGNYVQKNTIQVGNENITGDAVIKVMEELDPVTQEPTGNVELKPLNNTVKTQVTAPEAIIFPALSGMGLGWEAYKHYPQLLTDISDAIFDDDVTTTGIGVLIEALEDGGARAYCDKRTIEKIGHEAYYKGYFAPEEGQYIPQYQGTGFHTLTGGGMCTADDIYTLMGKPVLALDDETSIKTAIQNVINALSVGGQTPDSMLWNVHENYTQYKGYPVLEGYLFSINTYSDYNITTSANNNPQIDEDKSRYVCMGYFTITCNRDSGPYHNDWVSTSYNRGRKTREIARPNWLTTIGAEYINPVLGIKHNPDLPTVTDPDNVFENFNDWIGELLTVPTYNPDTGTIDNVEYLPIGLTEITPDTTKEPTSENQNQSQSGLMEQTSPFELPSWVWDWFIPSIDLPDIGTPSEKPTGNTPTVVTPTKNNSSKLFTVYNPSDNNLDSLGGYLWRDDIITQVVELFKNNPLDAIISLHQVYCTPSTTTPHNIILGTLNSGVSSPVVNNQYVTIDCGSVYVAEMYGDARDYLNVDVQIYLPFIGFRNIDPHDIVNCSVNVKYTIDVYCGSCLAQIIVNKNDCVQTLYTFEGNCSIQIPLTGSDRTRVIGAIASTVASGIATGGVGAVMMGASQLASGGVQTSIQRTSGFSGNCGAMAIKKPYIVLTRLKSADAVSYNSIVGNPTNKTVYLSNCKGYTRVKEIHIDDTPCTETEKSMLYQILKSGIVI